MIAGLWTYVGTALAAAALASAGTWRVQEWRWTSNTQAEKLQRDAAERLAEETRATDTRQQRKLNDTAAGRHAATVAHLNTQLGNARGLLATLSDRQCLDGSTVRLLNAIGKPSGGVGLRAPAGDTAGAPQASAGSAADGASERDTAQWIATCRAQYGEVAGQLSEILDIEARRKAAREASP